MSNVFRYFNNLFSALLSLGFCGRGGICCSNIPGLLLIWRLFLRRFIFTP
ncbi:hypothetical protein [Erwinia sp. E_sp_B01_9]